MHVNEWYWVLMLSAVGGSFLLGRWCGIRDFEKQLNKRQASRDHVGEEEE